MHDPGQVVPPDILPPAEARCRKALLRALQEELAARGIRSLLAGRYTLVLHAGAPLAPAGPGNPELYVQGSCRIAITDGHAYRFTGGRTHPADDPAGAAALLDPEPR